MENKQQKLGKRNTYTPSSAPQARRSVAVSLNRDQSLSEHSLKTSPNNPDVDLPRKREQDLRVPVINLRHKPLMPTTPKKAKKLVKEGKARVLQRCPFVIQMLVQTGEKKQDIHLNIDSGYSFVGFSAKTNKKELLSGELNLDNMMRKRLEDRAMYRRQKRNKLWYRKPRFMNRAKPKGWFAPSIQRKIDTHITLVEKIQSWMPITKTTVEIATFDTQKMQNPEISGIEYQQGNLQGYEVREYLLEKFNRKCVYCKKKDIPLEIEHVIPKSRGGSNRVSNLAISCKKCNKKKDTKTATEFGFPNIQKQCKASLRATAFMNVVRKKIVEELGCEFSYGYITKHNRIKANLEKSHSNDAFSMFGGTNQTRCKSYQVIQKRKNNRCLQKNRKGFKPSIRRKSYPIRPQDLVKINGRWKITNGTHCEGTRIMVNKKSINIKKIEGVIHAGTLNWRKAIPPTTKVRGSPCLI